MIQYSNKKLWYKIVIPYKFVIRYTVTKLRYGILIQDCYLKLWNKLGIQDSDIQVSKHILIGDSGTRSRCDRVKRDTVTKLEYGILIQDYNLKLWNKLGIERF